MSRETKATDAQVEERVNKVFDLIVNGASRHQICQYVAKKTDWQVSERTIDRYIASATKRIIEASKTKREEELGKAILRMEQIYFLSISLQNLQTAISAQREITKLLGLSLEEDLLKRVEMLERHYSNEPK